MLLDGEGFVDKAASFLHGRVQDDLPVGSWKKYGSPFSSWCSSQPSSSSSAPPREALANFDLPSVAFSWRADFSFFDFSLDLSCFLDLFLESRPPQRHHTNRPIEATPMSATGTIAMQQDWQLQGVRLSISLHEGIGEPMDWKRMMIAAHVGPSSTAKGGGGGGNKL
mmetsp:Transcript_22611/g.47925  ORF Transcript_22611/g.47925 Transcript_22611/m.47925 type:complete len:167 (+) Transcript_22611:383-883(+)|eukprot:CAMPEP_0184393944 /NCGR_PEP_ID=MMETSP0007-20130409/37548_1 /TAXON_ID=97485 /ORGANISM="Prymnesium parvum, Strain Texoma1" /LENGTH=166 /DNA_ID=CAMNT_0026745253 /DNA_START=382 /DNA_END=882 /DNA_ORIENTATION=-